MERLEALRALRKLAKEIGALPGFISIGEEDINGNIMNVSLVITVQEKYKDAFAAFLPELLVGVPYRLTTGERPKAL